MMELCADSLAVERGGREVIAPLCAALEPGRVTAICGPNGAGKSSLVLALAGLLPAAQGAVRLGETDLRSLPARERARAIGYLPQGSDIAWDVSVESLVALGRHPHADASGPIGVQAVRQALAAAHMDSFAKRPVSQLSGGEKARALLARVLAGEPQWILADEPLAALDLAHQIRLVAHLRRQAEAGRGVVIVLHDLALAKNHADRVLVLKDGALIADGAAQHALAPDIIARGWDVEAEWVGRPGAEALIAKV